MHTDSPNKLSTHTMHVRLRLSHLDCSGSRVAHLAHLKARTLSQCQFALAGSSWTMTDGFVPDTDMEIVRRFFIPSGGCSRYIPQRPLALGGPISRCPNSIGIAYIFYFCVCQSLPLPPSLPPPSLPPSLRPVKFSSCLFVVCLCTSLYCFPLATVLRLS